MYLGLALTSHSLIFLRPEREPSFLLLLRMLHLDMELEFLGLGIGLSAQSLER